MRIRKPAAAALSFSTAFLYSLAALQAPAQADPLPAPYDARAHADVATLSAKLLGGDLAGLVVGHAESTADSTLGTGNTTATSRNAELAVVGFPIEVDEQVSTAPESENPGPSTLLPLDLSPVASLGVISGDTEASYVDADTCIPAADGRRVLSDARTDLAGLSVLSVPLLDLLTDGPLVSVGASSVRSTTELTDSDGDGASDVVSTVEATVGDIRLLGSAVQVAVTSPVSVQAASDGTTGTAGFQDPATITVHVGETETPIPLNAEPVSIALPPGLELLADLKITGFSPTDQSSGATGEADLQSLLRIELDVAPVLGTPVAAVDLSLVPLHVEATAPEGGVECGDDVAPAAPVISAPVDGSTINDTTPDITGTGEPGAQVEVKIDDTVIGTTTVGNDGTWTVPVTTELDTGDHTVTATQTDEAGNTSPADTHTFTIDTTSEDIAITGPGAGETTNDSTPTISGVGEPESKVVVSIDGTQVGTATVADDGTWSLEVTDPLSEGEHTIGAVQTDPADNTATAEEVTFTVDLDSDDDGLTDEQEESGSENTGYDNEPTDPHNPDSDGDGLDDGDEITNGTDPNEPDTDGDGINDGDEVDGSQNPDFGNEATDPLDADSDDDGLTDGQETSGSENDAFDNDPTNPNAADTDDDGLTDNEEVTGSENDAHGNAPTDPNVADTDDDGLNDGPETDNGTDPNDPSDPDPNQDSDGDGLTDKEEIGGTENDQYDNEPTDPDNADSDGDGVNDGDEITNGTDPNDADTDDDGLNDGKEGQLGTDPLDADTDGDTLKDGREVNKHRTNPLRKDTDGDTLWDNVELRGSANTKYGKRPTNPLRKDTDRDGLHDGREVKGFKMGLRVRVGKGRFHRVRKIRTNPRVRDTDRDGLIDGREVKGKRVIQRVRTKTGFYRLRVLRSNPLVKDTDRDGLRDRAEVTGNRNRKFNRKKTDPANFDTDRGSVGDGREVRRGSDPTNHYSGTSRQRTQRMIG